MMSFGLWRDIFFSSRGANFFFPLLFDIDFTFFFHKSPTSTRYNLQTGTKRKRPKEVNTARQFIDDEADHSDDDDDEDSVSELSAEEGETREEDEEEEGSTYDVVPTTTSTVRTSDLIAQYPSDKYMLIDIGDGGNEFGT